MAKNGNWLGIEVKKYKNIHIEIGVQNVQL